MFPAFTTIHCFTEFFEWEEEIEVFGWSEMGGHRKGVSIPMIVLGTYRKLLCHSFPTIPLLQWFKFPAEFRSC